MPINYKLYPPNWHTEIRPAVLERAQNRCEVCEAVNHSYVFRGVLEGEEVYQDANANIFQTSNGQFIGQTFDANIYPSSGDENQQAIKIVLTIAHLDHDINNNDLSNLKALCQLHHNRHDAKYRAQNRKNKKTEPTLF